MRAHMTCSLPLWWIIQLKAIGRSDKRAALGPVDTSGLVIEADFVIPMQACTTDRQGRVLRCSTLFQVAGEACGDSWLISTDCISTLIPITLV